MSSNQTVDQRIVEMRFDNADFEKKVAQTLESLAKLRSGVNMENASKGMDQLAKSVKNVDVNSLSTEVETLNKRFSTLGIVGFTVIQRLTNAMLSLAGSVANKLMTPLKSAWNIITNKGWARAANIKQAQFMIENLGISWEKAYKDIDEAVTGTRFGFDEAATAASQLAASGLEFGTTMPDALKAIGNLASMTNTEFSDMARILTKSAAKGKVMMEELQQINERGLSGIDILSEYLEVSNEDLSKMLSKGQVSFDNLVQAVNRKFGDAAKKANETFSGVLANNKAVFARIGQVYASGFMDAAKIILQKTLPLLKGLEQAIKPFGELVSAIMVKFAEKLAPKIEAFASRMDGLRNKVIDILQPLASMFGIVLEKSDSAKKKVEETKETLEDLSEIAKQVISGKFGNGQERKTALEKLGMSYERVQNKVNELLGCSFRYEVEQDKIVDSTEEAAKANKKYETQVGRLLSKEGALNAQRKGLTSFIDAIWKHSSNLENLTYFIRGLSSSVEVIKTIVSDFRLIEKGAFVLKKIGAFISDAFGNFGRYLEMFNKRLLKLRPWYNVLPRLKKSFRGLISQLREGIKYVTSFKNIVGFGKRIAEIVSKIKNKVVELFKAITGQKRDGSISKRLKGVLDILAKVGKFIGSKLLGAVDSVLGVVNSLIDQASKLFGAFSGYEVLETILGIVVAIGTGLYNIINNLGIPDFFAKILQFFEPIKTFLLDVFSKPQEDAPRLFDVILEYLSRFGESVSKNFEGFREGGIVSKAVSLITDLKNAARDLPSLFGSVIESIKTRGSLEIATIPDSISKFLTSIANLGGGIKETTGKAIGAIFTNLAEGLRKLEGLESFSPFAGSFEIVANFLDSISKKAGEWATAVGTFVKGVIEKLSGFNFKGAGLIVLLSTLIYFAFTWSRVGATIINTLKALSTFVLNGGKAINAAKERLKGFLQIASSLALIAGALYLVSKIPTEQLKTSVAVIGGALLSMFAVIFILTRNWGDVAKLNAVGPAFVGLAGSLLVFAVAIKIFSKIDTEEFKNSITKILASIVILAAGVKLAGSASIGTGLAFVGLAAALLLLIPAIKAYAKIDGATLIRSAGSILIFTTIMVAAIKIAGKSGGAGLAFAGMAAGLLILAVAIKLYASMKLTTLAKGGAAVLAFMIVMATCARIAGNSSSKNLMALSVTLVLLAGALLALSTIPWQKLLATSISMGIVLGAVTSTLKSLSKLSMGLGDIGKMAIELGLVLGAVVASLYILTKMERADDILKIAASMVLVIDFMTVPLLLLQNVDWDGGLKAAVAFGSFLAGFVLAIGAIGGVITGIETLLGATHGSGFEWLAEQARGIGGVIHGFVSGLFPESPDKMKSDTDMLEPISKNLVSFSETIGQFFDSLSKVDDSMAERAKTMATAILALCAADLLEAIAGFVRGKADLSGFGESLSSLATSFIQMNEAIRGANLSEEDGAKIDQVITIVGKFADLAESIPKIDGIQQKIEGTADLAAFGDSMKSFIYGGFKRFMFGLRRTTMDEADINKVDLVKKATKKLADVAKAIPRTGGWEQILLGASDLGNFAEQMKTFMNGEQSGGGFKGFLKAVQEIAIDASIIDKIDTFIVPATESLVALGKEINDNKSIIEIFTGPSTLSSFGTNLSGFATGIGTFTETVKDVVIADVEGIVGIIKELATLNSSNDLKGNGLTTFGTYITNLGGALDDFNTLTQGLETDHIYTMIGALRSLRTLMIDIASGNYDGVDSFIAGIGSVATASVSNFSTEIQNNTILATTAFDDMLTACIKAIEARESDFNTVGLKTAEAYTSRFDCGTAMSKLRKSLVSLLSRAVNILNNLSSKFKNPGLKAVEHYCSGLTGKKDRIKWAGGTMVTEALNALKGYHDDFYREGENAVDGYVEGINAAAWKIGVAAGKAVQGGIDKAKAIAESASPSKVYRGLGHDAMDGYALGITDFATKVTDAVGDTATDGIYAMKDSIAKMDEMLDDNLDCSPTITPVMDLSMLASGVKTGTGMLSSLNGVTTDIQSALSVAALHNEALARTKARNSRDYSADFEKLIDNTRRIVDAAKQNKVAVINGDYLFNYVNTRMGMA